MTAAKHRVKLCAHLGYQFTEFPPRERFAQAAKAGFKAVEWPAVYQTPSEELRTLIDRHALTWVQVTLPTGRADLGEKGLTALPGREAEFAQGLNTAIQYARALDARWIHPMAGVVQHWSPANRSTYVANLRLALRQAHVHGLGVVLEVINPAEVPGYAMGSYTFAEEIFDELSGEAAPLGLLLDAYHGQTLTGDLLGLAKRWAGRIAHVQVADVPGRHEPGTGGLDFDAFFSLLHEIGYDGWIGCEYKPETTTLEGLRHLSKYLQS